MELAYIVYMSVIRCKIDHVKGMIHVKYDSSIIPIGRAVGYI